MDRTRGKLGIYKQLWRDVGIGIGSPGCSSESEVAEDPANAVPWTEPPDYSDDEGPNGSDEGDEASVIVEVKFHLNVLRQTMIDMLDKDRSRESFPLAVDSQAVIQLLREVEDSLPCDLSLNEYKRLITSTQKGITKTRQPRELGADDAGVNVEVVSVEEGEDVITKIKITKKMVVPDTTAEIFWLNNRNPERWSNKQYFEMSGNVITKDLQNCTTEDLKKLLDEAESKE